MSESIKWFIWFITSKKLEKFHDALLTNDDIPFLMKTLVKSHFFANEMGIPGEDLDKGNLNVDQKLWANVMGVLMGKRFISIFSVFNGKYPF